MKQDQGEAGTERMIGNTAPGLFLDDFFVGDPVHDLEKGRIHVLGFWATWCGPCRECFPILEGAQARYPDIVVIGVAVMDEVDQVRRFLADREAPVGFRIAIECRRPGEDVKAGGEMWHRWAEAYLPSGIPLAFVVDGHGRIAWSGHTRLLPDALDRIVAGHWDVAADAKRREDHLSRERVRENARFIRAWSDLHRQESDTERQRLLDDFVRECPEFELRVKVFCELEYRIAQGQSAQEVALYASHVLSLPAAQGVDTTDEWALREYVHALLRIGLALSNGAPGRRAAVGSADPRLAALAIEAFERVEPLLQEQTPAFLAQFDLYMGHALLDRALPTQAAARARQALRRADSQIIGLDRSVEMGKLWANLRQEAETLIAAVGPSG